MDDQLFGRIIHPVAAGMAVSGAVLFGINIISHTGLVTGAWSALIGWLALAYCLLLTCGWAWRSRELMSAGLLVAFGVWTSRTVLTGLQADWTQRGVYLSLGWAVIAGGSYWLERTNPRGRGRERSHR